jgi:FMN-dependent NADH-azoreductase
MPRVLDVHFLPRAKQSRTAALRAHFRQKYSECHPDTQYIEVDLARMANDLPALDEWDVTARYELMYGDGKLDERGAERWDALTRLTDQLHAANLLLISAPMWNLSIPWPIKRWLDCVVQSRLTFELDPQGGFRGLLAGRPAILLTTRDSAYHAGTPYAALDFQIPYLCTILQVMGLGPIHSAIAEGMGFVPPDEAKNIIRVAMERVSELARQL